MRAYCLATIFINLLLVSWLPQPRADETSRRHALRYLTPAASADRDAFVGDTSASRRSGDADVRHVNVLFTFTNVQQNAMLGPGLMRTLTSMLRNASVNISCHFLGDAYSVIVARDVFHDAVKATNSTGHEVRLYRTETLLEPYADYLGKVRSMFSASRGKFNRDFFFITLVVHRLLPHLRRVIKLDSDLYVAADVARLQALFADFEPEAVMGLSVEQQPVYYCAFRNYRAHAQDERAGVPASIGGHQGYNTGVILLDLERMRTSATYANATQLATLAATQRRFLFFDNHLGDQDIYSMIGMETQQLFYPLPCQWNRQLCTRYRTAKKFNRNLFMEYYACAEPVMIYHGNCGARLPRKAYTYHMPHPLTS
ncbi:PREDICTED: xyloside xylosyltransferase 1-like [Priapulus caudatus]|uniref:Xyloside xylosyltransferase 1-like n=1 Tax=Priapulus caudatus TaxID=37621 RepID=A0ABM1EDR6_PRICU|nr:PREDICTED: xyloside xylosyltransferase 1-like [Priapulus caudatus]